MPEVGVIFLVAIYSGEGEISQLLKRMIRIQAKYSSIGSASNNRPTSIQWDLAKGYQSPQQWVAFQSSYLSDSRRGCVAGDTPLPGDRSRLQPGCWRNGPCTSVFRSMKRLTRRLWRWYHRKNGLVIRPLHCTNQLSQNWLKAWVTNSTLYGKPQISHIDRLYYTPSPSTPGEASAVLRPRFTYGITTTHFSF